MVSLLLIEKPLHLFYKIMKKSIIALSSVFILPLQAYDLHEWGTFTTVSGSDGSFLTGLHVEEESLPSFVYSHLGMEPGFQRGATNAYLAPLSYYGGRGGTMNLADSKQIEVLLNSTDNQYYYSRITGPIAAGFKGFPTGTPIANVNVKMETPVIYFYGGSGEKVNVKVGFNGGSISQWYPQRLKGDTPNKIELKENQMHKSLKQLLKDKKGYTLVDNKVRDFSKNYQGSIEWDVELLDADNAFTFKSAQSPTWIYPKVPNANMVKVGNEYEDYLFYRGIGNIDLPVKFSVDANEVVKMENNSTEEIPFAFAFEKTGQLVRYKVLGKVKGEVTIANTEWTKAQPNWQVEVFSAMRSGLVNQGLTRDEANGMVKTWWKSYFEHDGLRIFWVVPQNELEKILPLEVNPKPEKSVRVIVGRGDILRPSFEKKLLATVGKKAYGKYQSDRFHAAYKNRLEALIKEPVFQHISDTELHGNHINLKGISNNSSLGTGVYLQKGKEINDQHFGKLGKWKVLNQNELMIGDLHFKLDSKTGIMTANVDKSKNPNSKWDRYEIQLRRYLN